MGTSPTVWAPEEGPDAGVVHVCDLENTRDLLGLPYQRDDHFVARKPLSAYIEEACDAKRCSRSSLPMPT